MVILEISVVLINDATMRPIRVAFKLKIHPSVGISKRALQWSDFIKCKWTRNRKMKNQISPIKNKWGREFFYLETKISKSFDMNELLFLYFIATDFYDTCLWRLEAIVIWITVFFSSSVFQTLIRLDFNLNWRQDFIPFRFLGIWWIENGTDWGRSCGF